MTQTKNVKRASFSLEDEYKELLFQIAELGRRSMTDEIRIMIDKRAQELGLKPITPFDPKPMASILGKSRSQRSVKPVLAG